MLNWLQNAVHRSKRRRRFMQIALGMGLLLGLAITGQQERMAMDELAATSNHLVTDHGQLKGTLIADPSATVADLKARQASLARRQAQREDISEVQAIWRSAREGHQGQVGDASTAMRLRTHQFQNGLFTWEVEAEPSQDVSVLLQALNRFPGWLQAPSLVQLQTDLSLPSVVTTKGWVFQIQADLFGKQGTGS
ncbi:MAG: hypothetical protein EBS88_07930 [Betaproteobacteria bacterium]|nr:hypothetical protein [Betaproteobacteria bacterium]